MPTRSWSPSAVSGRLTRAAVDLMVFVGAFNASIYFILHRQTAIHKRKLSLDHQTTVEADKRSPSFHQHRPFVQLQRRLKFAMIFYRGALLMYAVSTVKYSFIVALGLNNFDDYHYYDCYLLGRFRYIGRTGEVSYSVLFSFLVVFIIYRVILCSRMPNFKFDTIEFLLYDRRRVELLELRMELSSEIEPPSSLCRLDQELRGALFQVHLPYQASGYARDGRSFPEEFDPIIFVKNPYGTAHASPSLRWVTRPNRTSESWRSLAKYSLLMLASSLALYLFWFWLVIFLISGNLITNIGFELTYSKCVIWIQRHGNSAYLNVYTPAHPEGIRLPWLNKTVAWREFEIDMLPFKLPTDGDVQQLTAYNGVRIVYDFLENYFWYYDFLGFFIGQSFVILAYSIDIILNARGAMIKMKEIVRNLRASIDDFPAEWAPQAAARQPAAFESVPSLSANRSNERKLAYEISKIQIILADHFNMINGYNNFISFYFTMLFAVMFLYSFSICTMIANVSSRALELEFIMTEAIALMFCFVLLAGAAISRMYNLQLYRLISSAMALDNSLAASKTRWITIMKYFYPRPMYCFSLYGSIEISWLFLMKFTFWVISALMVIANFYYIYRAQTGN